VKLKKHRVTKYVANNKKGKKWKSDYPPPPKSNSKIYAWKEAKKSGFKTFYWKGARYKVDHYNLNKKTGKLNKK